MCRSKDDANRQPRPKEAERAPSVALCLRGGTEGGGKKSGKVRARENKPWAPHATELAQVIYSELPDPSDEDVALEIKTRWKLERPVPPGVRTLMRFVSELPKPGKLPKRAGTGPNRFRHEGGFVSDTKGASVSKTRASLGTYRCASRRKDARRVSMFHSPVTPRPS